MAQIVKNLSAIQETQIQSLGQEDSLEKEMTTHSSILPWRIPQTQETGRLQFLGSQKVGQDRRNLAHMHVVYTYQYYSLSSSHPLLPLLCKPLTPECPCLFLIKLGPFSNHLSHNFKEHFWTSNIYLHFQHLSLHTP